VILPTFVLYTSVRKLSLLLLLILVCWKAQAQSVLPIGAVKDEFSFFTTDNLGNIYTVRKHELKKFKPDGSLWLRFSDISLGDISFVDATNPMKILVFYKDFSRIQFVDNMLAERSPVIQLQQLGFDQSVVSCTSYDNGFWLFDQLNFELVRFNQDLIQTQDVKNLNQILGYEFTPNFLTEHNNWLYMNIPDKGILVFDIFGTYFKTIPLLGLTEFQVYNDLVYFLMNGKPNVYNMKTLQTFSLDLPDSISKFRIEKEKIFTNQIDQKDSIRLWKKQ
jgi:hypothetical protein